MSGGRKGVTLAWWASCEEQDVGPNLWRHHIDVGHVQFGASNDGLYASRDGESLFQMKILEYERNGLCVFPNLCLLECDIQDHEFGGCNESLASNS